MMTECITIVNVRNVLIRASMYTKWVGAYFVTYQRLKLINQTPKIDIKETNKNSNCLLEIKKLIFCLQNALIILNIYSSKKNELIWHSANLVTYQSQ